MQQLVIANWKMNPARAAEALTLFKLTNAAARGCKKTLVAIAAPAPYLSLLAKVPVKHTVALAGQDLSHEEGGAFTGEIGGSMLASVGASQVLVGHSERRTLGEDDERIARKMRAASLARLTPVLCVGEKERDSEGHYLAVVGTQVEHALSYLTASQIAKIVIAYEPVWAVGPSAVHAARPQDVLEMTLYIRRIITDRIGQTRAARVPILYGGSVEVGNAAPLITHAGVQGLLVGRASLKRSFAALIKEVDSG